MSEVLTNNTDEIGKAIRQEVETDEEWEYPEMLFMDGFDGALLGIADSNPGEGPVAVYSLRKIIETIMEGDDSELREGEEDLEQQKYDDAMEHYSFNIAGSWVGKYTPRVINDLRPPDIVSRLGWFGERERKPQFTKEPDDCLRCCIATLTGIPVESLPNWVEPYRHHETPLARHNAWNNDGGWEVIKRDLAKHNWGVMCMESWQGEKTGLITNPAPIIAWGKSPRGKGQDHAIIVQNGQMVYDPHKSGAGLDGDPHTYLVMTPIPNVKWRIPLNG